MARNLLCRTEQCLWWAMRLRSGSSRAWDPLVERSILAAIRGTVICNPFMKSEPSDRRVRVYYGGKLVADTLRPMLVWENPHYPAYYLPRADVKLELIPPHHVLASSLADLVRLEWNAMDAGFEEE